MVVEPNGYEVDVVVVVVVLGTENRFRVMAEISVIPVVMKLVFPEEVSGVVCQWGSL